MIHIQANSLYSIDIVVEIMLPVSMQFVESTLMEATGYTRIIHNKNRVDYLIPSLPLKSKIRFEFVALITDETLTPGLHYASTPMKLVYKSKLLNGAIAPTSHMISTVAQVCNYFLHPQQFPWITDI